MRKIKYLIIFFIISGSLFFLFGLKVAPEHLQVQGLWDSAAQSDVIIIFNSGGWGDTSLEEAQDFTPIIKGIQETLNEWGYNSIVIPYQRTEDTFLGKLAGTKDFFNSFSSSSEILAKDLKQLAENLPEKKIIMAGLSNGGAFVEETVRKIPEEARESICGIAVGVPFWHQASPSEGLLQLTNKNKDSLSMGEVEALLLSLVKTPFRWLSAKIKGGNLAFARAFQAPGHIYSWSSSEVGPQIVAFLEGKLR